MSGAKEETLNRKLEVTRGTEQGTPWTVTPSTDRRQARADSGSSALEAISTDRLLGSILSFPGQAKCWRRIRSPQGVSIGEYVALVAQRSAAGLPLTYFQSQASKSETAAAEAPSELLIVTGRRFRISSSTETVDCQKPRRLFIAVTFKKFCTRTIGQADRGKEKPRR